MKPIVVPRDLQGFIGRLHPELKRKIGAALEIILSEPFSGRALIKELSGLRSLRVGSFRIIYRRKAPGQVELIAVGPRERLEKEDLRLMQKERPGGKRKK